MDARAVPMARPRWRIDVRTAAALAAITVVRLVVAAHIELLGDEAYYWEWSRRLASGYFDHPPLVAYLIRASTAVFGRTALAVHLPAIVLALATSVVLYALVLDLYPRRHGLASASAMGFHLVPLLSMGAAFTTPDAPLVFFWLLAVYFVRRATQGGRHAWLLAGAAAALALLSKFNGILLPIALWVYVRRSPYRGWLRRPEPYLAAALVAVASAPILAWNAEHGWPSFGFQLLERHRRAFTPLLNLGRLALSQLTVSPFLAVAFAWGVARAVRQARSGNDAMRFLVCCAAAPFLLFGTAGIFTLTLANWFAVGYVMLLPCAFDALAQAPRVFRAMALGTAFGMTVLFHVQAAFSLVPLPRGLDYTAELHGWREAGNALAAARESLPAPERSFVFSHRFQFAALAAFYGPDAPVTRLGGRRDQYDVWRDSEALRGWDAVFLCDEKFFEPPNEASFRRCERAASLPLVRWGREVRTFHVWRCFGYGEGAPGEGASSGKAGASM